MARALASPQTLTLTVNGQGFQVLLSEHARARRISLRVDPIQGCVILVKPRRTSKATALAFAQEKASWISDRLSELLPPVPFSDGIAVPILGSMHTICWQPDARRGVWREPDTLNVSGSVGHMSRRVHDWFKQEARKIISPVAHAYAEKLDKAVTALSFRDTRSRWGSCTIDGKLSFSWRLLMAPASVLNYVVAHEVSHLCELNHSARFWNTVDRLVEDRHTPTAWLKEHGSQLHRYGLAPWGSQA